MAEKIRFLSTVWTIIEKAKHDKDAFQEVYLRYKGPVISFLSQRGLSKDAEDLAQEVFLKIFDQNLLQKVGKSRGRFRNFILTVTKNIVGSRLLMDRRQKRGAGKSILSLDEENIDTIPSQREREEFDKLWVLDLIEKACRRLEDECKKSGLLYHIALRLFLEHDMTYREVADQMNKTSIEVKNYIQRARRKLKEYVQDEIAFYSESVEEYNDELDYLSEFLVL